MGDCSLVNNYDWDKKVAYAICMAESGGDTNAANYNDDHGKCVGSFGLMQLACFWTANPTDPYENMSEAYEIYSCGQKIDNKCIKSWKPWGAFTSGAYLEFM